MPQVDELRSRASHFPHNRTALGTLLIPVRHSGIPRLPLSVALASYALAVSTLQIRLIGKSRQCTGPPSEDNLNRLHTI